MVSADGLIRGGPRGSKNLDFEDEEHPISVQIFGSEPDVMAEGARIVEERRPDVIDINCGCPARKVVKRNAGAGLLRDLPLLGKIVSAVVRSVETPVTVKMRTGWSDPTHAPDVARVSEDAGAAAVTVHGRTRAAGFSGEADWNAIRKVKESVSVPVVGNGDVRDPEAARDMMAQTGCDMVMVGRWAVGNPWIFRRIEGFMTSGEIPPEPTLSERIETAVEHLRASVAAKGIPLGVWELRRHLSAYAKGMRGAASLRRRLMVEDDPERVEAMLWEFLESNESVSIGGGVG
jgi:tRNA-dihydrouridine synthase B